MPGTVCSGTPILTDHGERLAETFAIGDEVTTMHGWPRPVTWIGLRSHGGRYLPLALRPVLIEAGALGDGLPERDLRLSPHCGVFLANMLVPAWALVNGRTIRLDDDARAATFVALELESHAIVWAAGVPIETYLDTGDRGMFHNASQYEELYPDAFGYSRRCAPRAETRAQIDLVRRALAALPAEPLRPRRMQRVDERVPHQGNRDEHIDPQQPQEQQRPPAQPPPRQR